MLVGCRELLLVFKVSYRFVVSFHFAAPCPILTITPVSKCTYQNTQLFSLTKVSKRQVLLQPALFGHDFLLFHGASSLIRLY